MIGVLGATGAVGTPLMAALQRDSRPVRALAHRPDDVAELAATVLTKGDHSGETILITGPEALSYPDCAELIGKAIGKAVGYEQLPAEDIQAGFIKAGMDEWFADAVVTLHRMYDTGELNPLTDAVQRCTGKQARSFTQFLDDNDGLFQ